MDTLTFSLHREVQGNDFLEIYAALKLPVTKSRVGFFEVALATLEGDRFVTWAKTVIEDDSDTIWDLDRVEVEPDRLGQFGDVLSTVELTELHARLVELLPIVEDPSIGVHVRHY